MIIIFITTEKKTESRKRKAISSKSKDQRLDENEDDSDSATKDIKKRKKKIIKKHFDTIRNRTKEDKCYEEWTNQFDDKKMIRLQDIKIKIVSTNKADMNFKTNFIALLINSLIESSSLGKANTNPLTYITSKTKIENIDWCSYLIDCLVKNKQSFDPSNSTSNFNGPSAYLVLLYLVRIKSDVLNIERTRPMICHWTSEKIKMRETFEKDELGDFGTGDFNDEYVDEELNEEAYEHVVMNKYKKLHMMIEDGINKFPENITLNHLKISFDAIFKDKSDNSNDDDDNGDDNDQSKKNNVGGENIERVTGQENENLEGGEEQQRKNKDEGGEDIKITDGEKDENDNNDQGLDDMNLNDEGVENDKGDNNKEEQNAEGEAVEGMNIERKNDKKVEGITGEQPQRDGEDGEKDENDNNDQGLDHMNLNDEGVGNKKGGNNKEEQNAEGEAVEGMNIERKNDKKIEAITGEQPQRDGEGVEGINMEGKIGEKKEGKKLKGTNVVRGEVNNDNCFDDMNLHDEGVENEKGGDNEEEQNVEGEEFSSTEMLNDDEFNSVYEKSMKEYQNKKEESMMASYDLKISQLTPPEMTENTAEQKKDEGEKENLVKDALDPKAKNHPKIKIVNSKNRNKESLPDLTEKQNGTVYDQLLFTINKRVVFRYVFESFFPGEYLFSDVIDSWSALLNYNEKDRDINNSPYRVFLSIQMTTKYIEDEQLPKPKKDDKRKKIDKKVKEQMEKEAKEKDEYRYNLFKKYFVDWF
ncbi:unnamed protein product [Lactuca virosa]|uniref:Uncharacterized protein n=1 Tax=Lactuca virosa TaxID=75947 RepID=A0AAU9P4T4_9ASTR|nr:unnamed protein product [Lactuca virosa]